MQGTNRFPSKYILKTLNLINYKGITIDIKQALIDIDLQFDIFNSTVHGVLRLKDKADFQQNFPLIGEERIEIEFGTDGESGFTKYKFYAYQQADKVPFGNDAFTYSLPFVSEDFMRNEETVIRQSFYKTNIANIIDTVIKKVSTKKVYIDETINQISFIPPSIKPFEVINYCLPRCISKQYPNSAGYVFYEDINGYNVKTIDSLYHGTAIPYKFSKKNYASNDFNNEMYSVSNYEIIQHYNVLDNMVKGMYGSTVYELNPFTRTYTKNTYDYFSEYNKTEHLSSNNPKLKLHTSTFSFPNTFKGLIKSYPTYGYQDKAKRIATRMSQLNQISNGLKMIIEVPGNTELNVGGLIELSYPSYTGHEDQTLDLFLSGKYLITSVRHILTVEDFSSSLEIIKDSYTNDHEQYNRTGLLA